ncbi:MAG: chorismate mutase/prephenate dehydratase [Parasphingorhabdus sp.]|jgi:chorismate mutase/prephenate dehydratase
MTESAPTNKAQVKLRSIDKQLQDLLEQRIEVSKQLAESYRADFEAQTLLKVNQRFSVLYAESVTAVFRDINAICRQGAQPLSVVVLGPEGTYTEAAARKHFGRNIKINCAISIEDIFSSVESGDVAYGVTPVENSTEGAISNSLDQLQSTKLTICGEIFLPIRHCLLAIHSDKLLIRKVVAHSQSLAQCRRWLTANMPTIETEAVASNAEAAKMAADNPTLAAIAGENVAEIYELQILQSAIQDVAENTTRFLVLGSHSVAPSGKDKTSILLSTQNKPGALYDLLKPLAKYNISMTKIESRPSRAGLWEYLFYVDLEGHIEEENMADALDALRLNAALFKWLGSYPAAIS